ncbi:uncharacterized protein A1O5_07025 [Cladophialophora psammophila CBS 110553]|uniref:WW domain-containing protein n=1 Tax=Cladophialophora psammophila CBS 110553 TaxID=1182543 RepID=W9WP53_9EURO|nr:uncharacterized protein A1O5_07025 [Cladophialophora psammophila CBS 110553]EXJ69952.1 hypothetical protein A1O5_07025 [Cladophialophora psammophila CBS 110553]
MSDFAPPSGPPPPKVPEGWKAVWNDQYKEWFYVNLHTKESTWEKPTAPTPGTDADAPPGGPPPSYSGHNAPQVSDAKRPLESNNPYNRGSQETDEEMARRLQNEENTRGAAESYYNSGSSSGPNPPGIQGGYPGAPSSPSNPLPPRPDSSGKSKGFLGKLLGKSSGSSSPYVQQARPGAGYPPQPAGYNQGYPAGPPGPGFGGPGYGPPGPGYGGYGPPQGYGGYPPGPGYGGYGGYAQAPPKRSGGLGAGGAAALGLGGGLLGGALLADAFNDSEQGAYQQGYDDGADGGGGDFDGGGDF